MDPRSDAPITSSSGNSPTSSCTPTPSSGYDNEVTPGATFDAVFYEVKKNIARISAQNFFPDCALRIICYEKIARSVATILAAKPEGYVWSLKDYAELARQRSLDRQPQADMSYGAASSPIHDQGMNKDKFYTPGHPQLTSTATSPFDKGRATKARREKHGKAWSPEWIAYHSHPRHHDRECRYCREASRDRQGNITHTIVKCGKLWLNVYLSKYSCNGTMPPLSKTPPFVTNFLATARGRNWIRNYTPRGTHAYESRTSPDSLAAREAFLDLWSQHTKPTTSPSSVSTSSSTSWTLDTPLLCEDNELAQALVVVQATAVKDLPKKPRFPTPTPAFLKWMSSSNALQNDMDLLTRSVQRAHSPRYLTALEGVSTATSNRPEIFATTSALQATDLRSYRDVVGD
jgi:hypothetical protein